MKALTFGEVLWDIFGTEELIGGAPFNLAAHLVKMGAAAHVVSAVGDDALGDRALAAAREIGVSTDFISRLSGVRTGTVDVNMRPDGSHTFTINRDVAWDRIELSGTTLERIASVQWDFFAFGTLAQRTEGNRKALAETLSAIPKGTSIVYDINLRQDYYTKDWIESSLHSCGIVKLNEDEAATLSPILLGNPLPVEEFAKGLSEKYAIGTVCITLGADGACILSGRAWSRIPGIKVEIGDTVGAGDAFTAGMLFAIHNGLNAEDAAGFAGRLGAYVTSKRGAIPQYCKEIEEEAHRIRKR